MGWSEKGKRGIHSGRTLRRNVNHRRDHGVIVKYKENTADIPDSVTESLLQDRYGLTDGWHTAFIPYRGNDVGVELSLGKRKRWLLQDLVKERILEEPLEDNQEVFEETEDVHLCFQERHIFHEHQRTRGDCVSVFSDHDGEISPKHVYSFYSDIRHRGDKAAKPAEIGYEICIPPALNAWPNLREDQRNYYTRFWDLQGKKSKCKCKGIKNKGNRFGNLYQDDHHELVKCRKGRPLKQTQECKVKTVSKKEFQMAHKTMDNLRKPGRLSSLHDYIDPIMKGNTGKVKNEKIPDINSSEFKKYGKGCAIFVEDAPMKPGLVPQKIQAKSFIEPQHKVSINVELNEIEPTKLHSEWHDCYTEGTVSPRKFAINITSLLPNNKLKANVSNVVFELQDQYSHEKALTSVSLVHATFDGKSELDSAAQDFAKYLPRVKDSCATWQVKDVVQAALQCIRVVRGLPEGALNEPQASKSNSSKSVPNLNLLNALCGWKSEAFTLEEAQQQIKEKLFNEEKSSKITEAVDSNWTMVYLECGICYGTFEDNSVTSLTECGHSFCNECWAGHLETQVSQGVCHVKCPGFECDCKVDGVTMMSMKPLLYERYVKTSVNKYLETSPEWKWCPGKHCQKLVKAIDTNDSSHAMTVLCSCTTTWCFKCMKKSHWPATCAESKKFLDKSGSMEHLLELESQEHISSVMVKNCPQCNYPIEKFHGCQFMHCVLCNVHFCWNCLTVDSYGHHCEKSANDDLTEVFLNFRSNRYQIQKYLKIVLDNTNARKPHLLTSKKRKLEKLEEGQSSYCTTSSMLVLLEDDSRVSRFMETIVNNKVLKTVREAVEFEFQARVVVEGLAQKAAIAKTQEGKTAMRKMSQLLFITERIDCMLEEPNLMCKDDRLSFLKRLLEIGTECIASLKD